MGAVSLQHPDSVQQVHTMAQLWLMPCRFACSHTSARVDLPQKPIEEFCAQQCIRWSNQMEIRNPGVLSLVHLYHRTVLRGIVFLRPVGRSILCLDADHRAFDDKAGPGCLGVASFGIQASAATTRPEGYRCCWC